MKKAPKIGSKFMRDYDAKIFVCIKIEHNRIATVYVLKDEKKGTLYRSCYDFGNTYSAIADHSKRIFFELMEE